MSGLAAVHALTRAGLEVSCYEAGSNVGGMWRYENDSGMSAAYRSLQTNTSRERMQYPSFPMPGSMPEFPHHSDVLAYLESYATEHDLARHISFRARVEQVRSAEGEWEVTAAGDSARRFDWVVVAGGHYWDPAIPTVPGEFSGTLIHARDYRTPERLAGMRVVVVGGSQSALDIATEISTLAQRTILACDHVHHLIPWRIFGRPYDELDTAMSLLAPLPIVSLMMRAAMRIARVTPDRGALPPAGHPLFSTRWPAVVSPRVEAAVAAGAFASRPSVSALERETVVFADGTTEPADAIVFASGYRINFPFLAEDLGSGRGFEFPLYRRILSPHVRGLAFIGVLEPGPGLFEIVERQSQWLAAVITGRLPIPDDQAIWRAIDAGGERRSRRQFAATGAHTILCNRHAYLRVLARDLSKRHAAGSMPAAQEVADRECAARPTERPRPGRRLPAAVASARLQARLLSSTANEVASADASGTLADLAKHRYALLVTFRGDGTPVATPVWAAVARPFVYIRAERNSGKVKRLRKNPRALLAPCTSQGRPLGAPVLVTGRVLDAREAHTAEHALAGRYGIFRAVFERTMDMMRVDMCHLALSPEHSAEPTQGNRAAEAELT